MVKNVLDQKDVLIQQAPMIYYGHPLIAMELLDVPQNKQKGLAGEGSLKGIRSGSLILWDNWFSVREARIEDRMFQDTSVYQLVDQHSAGVNEVKLYLRRKVV